MQVRQAHVSYKGFVRHALVQCYQIGQLQIQPLRQAPCMERRTDGLAELRRRSKTEVKAKVVAVIWGTYLNAALTILQQGCFEQKFLKNIYFCWVVVWYGQNQMIIHVFQASIPPCSLHSTFFKFIRVEKIQCCKQTAVTTFAISSVFTLLFCGRDAVDDFTENTRGSGTGNRGGTLQSNILARYGAKEN